MADAGAFTPITEWGRWLHDLAQLPDGDLAARDIGEINLRCAADLPGTDNSLLDSCLEKVGDWCVLVDRYTEHLFPHFRNEPDRFQNSESRFRVAALAECLQRYVGITYNLSFLEGDYDASDSRNLFIHGILTGFGGTCVSMPVLFCGIGRRLGYPLTIGEASEHFFCRWDDDSEHFCFDATGRGVTIRNEDYYRQWPNPVTPARERNNGFIRSLTRHEELAAFAEARGNCLFDNFHFVPAVEAFYLSHKIAPTKQSHRDAWGLAIYASRLWTLLRELPLSTQDEPVELALRTAAEGLSGLDADSYRDHAIKDILRIAGNRRRRERVAAHGTVFKEITVQG